MVFSFYKSKNSENAEEQVFASSTENVSTVTDNPKSPNSEFTRKLSLPSTLLPYDSLVKSQVNNFRSTSALNPSADEVENERDFRNAEKLSNHFRKNLNTNVNLANKFYFGEDISILEPLITPLNLEIYDKNDSPTKTDELNTAQQKVIARRISTESLKRRLSSSSA
jgi:hypothetical protein